jgi:hypothetical protein
LGEICINELLAQLTAFYHKYKHLAEQDDIEHVEHLLDGMLEISLTEMEEK